MVSLLENDSDFSISKVAFVFAAKNFIDLALISMKNQDNYYLKFKYQVLCTHANHYLEKEC